MISACLGPSRLGSPCCGMLNRLPGDLVVLGTDGVFSASVDWDEDLPSGLARAALHHGGDLQRTVDATMEELNLVRDDIGFLFDDNMTLALIGTGEAVRMPHPAGQAHLSESSSSVESGTPATIPPAPAGTVAPGGFAHEDPLHRNHQ